MHKKIKISISAIAGLMLAILMVNLVMAATLSLNTSISAVSSIEEANQDVSVVISAEQLEDTEQLKELAPATIEEAERNIYPVRHRFLMWTNDGLHIMWGILGNGRFVGTDNLGKRCWGIYGKGVFAGFYDGDFFWGKYSNGLWKAEYLFGLDNSCGSYLLFPSPAITSEDAASP